MKTVKALLYCTKSKPFLYKTNFVSIENIKKGNITNLLHETDTKERLYLNGEKRLLIHLLLLLIHIKSIKKLAKLFTALKK